MKLLFIGDVTGKPGLSYLEEILPELVARECPDLVVANGENVGPNGRGITPALAETLYDAGVEILTLGNHVWDQREVTTLLNCDDRVVRPANFHPSVPGKGYTICKVGKQDVAIVNLIGRTFMGLYDCPFTAADRILKEISEVTPFCFVDFHAEATSEKLAMGWYLAGRVSAVIGTHTHVQSSDERILPGGTAYLTDVGMTGPYDGILGVKKELIIGRFLDSRPVRFELADGPCQFSAVVIDLDDHGKAKSITRIHEVQPSS